MRKCHGSESGVADRGVVELQHRVLAQRVRIVHAEAHEEVVRMLRVHERPAVGGLAGLKKLRVAPSGNGGRLETQHRFEHDAAPSQGVFRGAHQGVRGIELVSPTGARLLNVDKKRLAHKHQVPGTNPRHQHRHRPARRVHAGARCHVHEVHPGGIHLHFGHFVLHARHLHLLVLVLCPQGARCKAEDRDERARSSNVHKHFSSSSDFPAEQRTGERLDSQNREMAGVRPSGRRCSLTKQFSRMRRKSGPHVLRGKGGYRKRKRKLRLDDRYINKKRMRAILLRWLMPVTGREMSGRNNACDRALRGGRQNGQSQKNR